MQAKHGIKKRYHRNFNNPLPNDQDTEMREKNHKQRPKKRRRSRVFDKILVLNLKIELSKIE
jgi:hypothetical protein